jgi:valacyclovir hydrolase
MRYHTHKGARLAYLDEGSGDPLLLLHGFTGTAQTDFEQLITQLRASYRVVAPDLRGYGASAPPARDFPIDFYQRDADDAASLLDALGCGPVVVLGFSDGGESALLLAATRPDLVRGVIAWGVCGIISPAMAASAEKMLPVEAWGADRADWRAQIVANHGEEQLVPMIEGWVAAARAIAGAGGDIALDRAGAIRCPTLIINGDGEIGNPLEDARRLAVRIPSCLLEIMPESGHGVHWDQPERFLALVRAALAEFHQGV